MHMYRKYSNLTVDGRGTSTWKNEWLVEKTRGKRSYDTEGVIANKKTKRSGKADQSKDFKKKVREEASRDVA